MLLGLLAVILLLTLFLCHQRKRNFFRWMFVEAFLAMLLTVPFGFLGLFFSEQFSNILLTVFVGFWCFLGAIGLALVYILPPSSSVFRFYHSFSHQKKEHCPHCHAVIPAGANYCTECESPVSRTYDYDSLK